MLARHGTRICYASDEMYLLAGLELPGAEHYEAFDQLENGVGMWALLRDEFVQALAENTKTIQFRDVSIATGISAAPLLRELVAKASSPARVYAIENVLLGRSVTVSGLVAGRDLISQLRGKPLGQALLIPQNMLRREGDLFLDGTSVHQAEAALGVPIEPTENNGAALLGQLTVDS